MCMDVTGDAMEIASPEVFWKAGFPYYPQGMNPSRVLTAVLRMYRRPWAGEVAPPQYDNVPRYNIAKTIGGFHVFLTKESAVRYAQHAISAVGDYPGVFPVLGWGIAVPFAWRPRRCDEKHEGRAIQFITACPRG